MKQTVQMDKIQKNMRPGIISIKGFLGQDKRKLIDILIEDDAVVKRMDMTHEQIAKRMAYFFELGYKGLGNYVEAGTDFKVKTNTYRGKIPCPFKDGVFPKANITVKNIKKNKEIIYTDLNIHMIEKHGFYEGKGSVLRLDPSRIADILEVKSVMGADRRPKVLLSTPNNQCQDPNQKNS